MGLTHFPNGVASFGIPVIGAGPVLTTGNVFFVDSGSQGRKDAADHGRSPDLPFATIDYAIGRCTASNGDVIFVMPGHAETVSAGDGINLDVAGVRVIGLGSGAARPTITMSAVASSVGMNAASCSLENLLFDVQHDCTIVVDIDAADCSVIGCEFRARTAATAREWVTAIDVNGGAANACDRTRILHCIFRSPTAGASNCIGLDEVAANVEIGWCQAWGDFADAPIHNPTGKVLTQLYIHDCVLENTQTGDHSLELVSACTGVLARNLYKNDMTQATGSDPGSCWNFENYHSDLIDTSGILSPAAT